MSQDSKEKRPGKTNRRQSEEKIEGVDGLYLAVYPSGRRVYIIRFRDRITKKKTSRTLGVAK